MTDATKALIGALRRLLHRHRWVYVGMHWTVETPWMKYGWNYRCDDCGKRKWERQTGDPHFVVGGDM